MGNRISCAKELEGEPTFRKELMSGEIEWVKLQPFLLLRGYTLRPRYRPGWEPSWKRFGKSKLSSQDRSFLMKDCVIDATRVADGKQVVIKMVPTDTNELPIMQFLNHKGIREDPRNKFVEVLDVLLRPDTNDIALVVMPKLILFAVIPFQFLSEVLDAFIQFYEGLSFLHEHNIAHMDAQFLNMMMDPTGIVPDDFHFSEIGRLASDIRQYIRYTSRREMAHTKYFFIDAGISIMFPPGKERSLSATWGAEKDIPEHRARLQNVDPFHTDVCQVGNVLKRFVKNFDDLSILQPVVDLLTFPDPKLRPSAYEASMILREVSDSLPDGGRNQRIWYKSYPTEKRQRMISGVESSPSGLLFMWSRLSTNMS